jgi:inner membrane protein involved in colicin E2 resistance
VTIDGKALQAPTEPGGAIEAVVEVASGEERELRVAYKTRGIRQWRYDPTGGVGRVRNLNARVTTDFLAVDYPDGCLSPMRAEPQGSGMALGWTASDLITRAAVGVIVPGKMNPGPIVSRITFFAPVCLVFFFILVGTIAILYEVGIHPMHYLFVAAGFFAFHLLLAYLADHVTIHAAFPASAATSVVLVTTYLCAALRGRFPWRVALGGQAFFLVLFSYSFFLEGMTGLVVALGSVVTLAFLMRVTAHVDWEVVFRRPDGRGAQRGPRPTGATG